MTQVDARAGKDGPTRQVAQIGWREWVGLPRLGVPRIKAKIDTGARTAALHAEDVEAFERDGVPWVRFKIAGGEEGADWRTCEAPVADKREIRNTSGVPEERYIINTSLRLGSRRWSIEVSLANRAQMGFELILGRTAIRRRRLVVNPGRSFLAGEPKKT